MYERWLDSIEKQINEYKNGEQTDLIKLHEHLSLLMKDIQKSPSYIWQVSRYPLRNTYQQFRN